MAKRSTLPLLLCIWALLTIGVLAESSGGCFHVTDRVKHFGVCNGILKYDNIYVNVTGKAEREAESLRMLNEIENTAVRNPQFTGAFKSAAPTCHKTYVEFMCQRYLPACYTNERGVDVPVYNCKASCDNTRSKCIATFRLGGEMNRLPQCTNVPDQVAYGSTDVPYTDSNCIIRGTPVNISPGPTLWNADQKDEWMQQLKAYKAKNGGKSDGFKFGSSKAGSTDQKATTKGKSSTTTIAVVTSQNKSNDAQDPTNSTTVVAATDETEEPASRSIFNFWNRPKKSSNKSPQNPETVSTVESTDATATTDSTESAAAEGEIDPMSMFGMSDDNDTSAMPRQCPRPLVRNPAGPNAPISIPNCPLEGCCMPCPFYHTLFPAGAIRNVEIWLTFLNLLSVPFTLVTLYVIGSRPGAFRSTKMLTVIFSLLNVFFMQAVEGILLITHNAGHDYMCDGPVKNAINKAACTIEGAAYTFFGVSFAYAEVVFNLNLFMLLQYKRPLVKSRWLLFVIFGAVWATCAVLTALPYAKSGSVHMFGTHCTPQDMKMYTKTGVYPVIVGLLLNVIGAAVNVFKIVQLGIRHFGSSFFTSSAASLKRKIEELQRQQQKEAMMNTSALSGTSTLEMNHNVQDGGLKKVSLSDSNATLAQTAATLQRDSPDAFAIAEETASSGFDSTETSDAEPDLSEVDELEEMDEPTRIDNPNHVAAVVGNSNNADKKKKKKKKRRGQIDFNLFLSARRLVLLSLLVAVAMSGFMVWWFSDAGPKLGKAEALMGLDNGNAAAANDNGNNAAFDGSPLALNGTATATGADALGGADDATVEWGQRWIECLTAHEMDDPISGGQNACSYIPQEHVPTQRGWTTMEIMSSVMGVLYFLALGTSFADWSRIFAPPKSIITRQRV